MNEQPIEKNRKTLIYRALRELILAQEPVTSKYISERLGVKIEHAGGILNILTIRKFTVKAKLNKKVNVYSLNTAPSCIDRTRKSIIWRFGEDDDASIRLNQL